MRGHLKRWGGMGRYLFFLGARHQNGTGVSMFGHIENPQPRVAAAGELNKAILRTVVWNGGNLWLMSDSKKVELGNRTHNARIAHMDNHVGTKIYVPLVCCKDSLPSIIYCFQQQFQYDIHPVLMRHPV